MAAYQKCGVTIVTVILAILQCIKSQNYRLFILYEETTGPDALGSNLTRLLNNTDTLFEGENVTKFQFQCLLVNSCLAVLTCVYMTSWSDKHGRKLLLTLPYIGSFISDIFMLVILFIPSATSKFLLISEGVNGLLGGTMLMILGCLCYITDSTDHRQRTLHIALFLGLYNAIPVIDMALQYFWTPLIGLELRVLILSAVIYRMFFTVCFLVYIRLCVSESVFLLGSFEGNPWMNLVTPINVSDVISCVFRRRLDNMRFYIIVLSTIFTLYTISLFGNIITFPMYFRTVFTWSFKDVLVFSTVFTSSQSLVLWFSTYLAMEWKSLDSDLGKYGCLSLGISCLVLTFATQSYIAAIGVLVGVGSLFVPVSIVSLLSKLVERSEIGSMFAGVGFLTLMTQLIAFTSYTALNDMCAEAEIPQVIFLLSFALIAFSLFFFIYLKKNISPHLLGHLTGSESLVLINRKGQIERLFEKLDRE